MLEFKKNDGIKFIDEKSGLIPALLADGWKCDVIEVEEDIEELKAKAEALGIKVHHKAGIEKIKALIAEKA